MLEIYSFLLYIFNINFIASKIFASSKLTNLLKMIELTISSETSDAAKVIHV